MERLLKQDTVEHFRQYRRYLHELTDEGSTVSLEFLFSSIPRMHRTDLTRFVWLGDAGRVPPDQLCVSRRDALWLEAADRPSLLDGPDTRTFRKDGRCESGYLVG